MYLADLWQYNFGGEVTFSIQVAIIATSNTPLSIIIYLEKGLTTKEIHADMVSTLGDNAPALSTVKKWAAEFKIY